MKKIGFYILALAATLFASCEGDYDDWAAPQGFEEEAPEEVTLGVTSIGAINMVDVTAETIQLFTPDLNVPEGYSLVGYTAVIDNEYELPVTISGQANVSDIKAIVESIYGKAPYERELSLAVTAHLKKGEKAFIKSVGEQIVKVTLVAPYISKHYYVIGAPSEWNPSCTTLPFNHSGKDVYDDPIFTVTFPVSAGDTWFALTDDKTVASGNWSDVLACAEGNGNNGMEGGIKRRSEMPAGDDGSWKISVDKDCTVKMTINMMDYTYKFEFINYKPFIYFIGATDGWSAAEQKLALTDSENGIYTGFIYCADPNGWGNQFKFQQVAGDWGTELNNSHFSTYGGAATDCGGNLGVSGGENVYYFSVNLGAGEIYAEEVTKMGIIGDFNGWGGDLDMTWNAAEYCYEANISTVTANGWKFRINGDWAVNLGGDSLTDLVANGNNLSATGTNCKLYPTRRNSETIYCTVE